MFTDIVDGDRAAPLAATRDIAAAAGLLLDRSWSGTDEVPVLGPEDLSPNDVARIMSEVLARPVRYERQPLDDFRAALTGHGAGDAVVEGFVAMMTAKDSRPRHRRAAHRPDGEPDDFPYLVRGGPQAGGPGVSAPPEDVGTLHHG